MNTDVSRLAKRIQRQRTKGWRMPPGAVYVGRPSRWGNPFPVGSDFAGREVTAARAFDLFSLYMGGSED